MAKRVLLDIRAREIENAANGMANRLASVKAIPRLTDDEIHLQLEATFTPQTYALKNSPYEITIGVKEAHIVLETPGHDRLDPVEATLSERIWTDEHNSSIQKGASIGLLARVGAQFGIGKFGVEAKANAAFSDYTKHVGKATYPIIRSTTEGWQIGGPNGDPRNVPSLAENKKWMLNGTYFKGHNYEMLSGAKSKSGSTTAKLRPIDRANDSSCRAVLFAAYDGLAVEVKRSANVQVINSAAEDEHSTTLKGAVIQACVQRAKREAKGNGQLPERLNPDIYIASHNSMIPRSSSSKVRKP